jgi:nucleoside-diphosphate-sugar epimerase
VRRIAVTGATGFIGRHVCAHLANLGDEVRAIVRPSSTSPVPPDVTVVRADLDAGALRDALGGVEAVVHLAGVIAAARDEEYISVNALGARAVAEAARSAGSRFIHVSSLAAAGPASAAHPRSEDEPASPITMYGKSKLESERMVREVAGLSWVILRPGVVYGPWDRAVLPLFKMASRGALPLVGRPGAAFTFVYVSDLVRTIEAALATTVQNEVFFVGHPRPVTARQIVEGIRRAVGRRALIVPIPLGVTWAFSRIGDLAGAISRRPVLLDQRRYAELSAEGFVCRVDRLRAGLGVTPEVGLEEGLETTASWYRQAGWL